MKKHTPTEHSTHSRTAALSKLDTEVSGVGTGSWESLTFMVSWSRQEAITVIKASSLRTGSPSQILNSPTLNLILKIHSAHGKNAVSISHLPKQLFSTTHGIRLNSPGGAQTVWSGCLSAGLQQLAKESGRVCTTYFSFARLASIGKGAANNVSDQA